MKEHRQKEAPWRGPREASRGSEISLVGSEPANRAPHKRGNSEVRNEVIRGRANTRHEESMLKQRAASLAKSGPQLAERPRGPDLAITGAAVSERGYAVQKCVASSLFLKASLDGKRGRSECEWVQKEAIARRAHTRHERSYLERGVPPSPRDRRHPQTPMAVANSRLLVEP